MTALTDHFHWRVDTDMDGDVELEIFQLEDDVLSFNWDLGVFWNQDLARACSEGRKNNTITVDYLPQWMYDIVTGSNKDAAESFVIDVVNRIPRSEQRVIDHMEAMLSHVLRAVADVSKTPFMVYDASSGVWRREGEWASERQVGTSVGSIIDRIVTDFTMAMSRAVEMTFEMIDEVRPSPGPKPNAASGQQAQWQVMADARKRLTDKAKEAEDMVRQLQRGKNRAVKSGLQDRLAIAQTYWDGPDSMRWLILRDGVIDLEDVKLNGRVTTQSFSPWHLSTMALDVSWSEAEKAGSSSSEWLRGLRKLIPDEEVRKYLQKRFGAALMGRPGEAGKSMVWQHGVGDTGKSTVQEAIAGAKGVFAPYSYQADAEVLTKKGAERGATDRFCAYVRGKRFAIISELDAGAQLNQGKFKQMTGGETVSGTAKYSNEVAYFFTATLFVSSNDSPQIPWGDTALSNRIHAVPFVNKLIVQSKVSPVEWKATPAEKRADEGWLHKLLLSPVERAAILKWVLEGLVLFGEEGLGALPEAIREEQKKFVNEGDPIARTIYSLLGDDDESSNEKRLHIYTNMEWELEGWNENLGLPVARFEQLLQERARDLGLTNDFGELSRKQLTAAKKMLDELGGSKGKVCYGTREDGRTVTGLAFRRSREVTQGASV